MPRPQVALCSPLFQTLQNSDKMSELRIYADFQKVDAAGFLVLTAQGSIRDLDAIVEPKEGKLVVFYSDDENDFGEPDELEVDGELKFDSEHNIWLGIYDSNGFRHASERCDSPPS